MSKWDNSIAATRDSVIVPAAGESYVHALNFSYAKEASFVRDIVRIAEHLFQKLSTFEVKFNESVAAFKAPSAGYTKYVSGLSMVVCSCSMMLLAFL